MLNRLTLLLLLFLCIGSRSIAQNAIGYVSGPMLGYCEQRSVLIWLEVNKIANNVAITYWERGKPYTARIQTYEGQLETDFNAIKFEIGGLKMNTTYDYKVVINKVSLRYPDRFSFKTKDLWEHRKPAPDFSFVMGSCLYVNDEVYDRPGKPYGSNFEILDVMADVDADFNLWLGDNTYLREADYSSDYGIRYRYSHTRSETALKRILAVRPNYAIWDDHDYGPNDSNLSFDLKNFSRKIFAEYWGNKTYGHKIKGGIYSRFSWSDADFFLMDNRYFRSANKMPAQVNGQNNSKKKYLGETQMDWLKNALISSTRKVKFIVGGGQWLNESNPYECFTNYSYEFDELVNFIKDNKIEGVIFLSGDRHFSEMITYEKGSSYTLYDITSSPLTSGVKSNMGRELENPARVEGTLLNENNFIRVSVKGSDTSREIYVEAFDKEGKLRWEYRIPISSLKFN